MTYPRTGCAFGFGAAAYALKLMLLGTVVVAGSHLLASTAFAAPIVYTFLNASTVLRASPGGPGSPEAITGTFTFDPVTLLESNVEIVLTGAPAFAGSYVHAAASPTSADVIQAEMNRFPAPSAQLRITFQFPLGIASDPLSEVVYDAPLVIFRDFSPSGSAVAAIVPEPSSLTLAAVALGLFLVGRRKSGGDGRSERI
jgi:hypothetical protein